MRSRLAAGPGSGGDRGTHAAEAVEPGAAHQVEQHRLGLVVGGVAEQRVGGEHGVAGGPGPGLEVRARLDVTRSARNAAPKPSAAVAHHLGLSAAEPARRPWSTWTAVTSHPAATASTSSASESAPPDTAHVTAVPGRRERAAGAAARWRGRPDTRARRQADASRARDPRAIHADGSRISAMRRQIRRALPGPVEQRAAAGRLDRLDEPLALLVLVELGLEPDQLLQQLGESRCAVWRRWRSTRPNRSALGMRPSPARSIVMSPWPSSRLISPLHLIEHRPLLGRRRTSAMTPPSASGLRARADGLGDAAERVDEPLGVGIDRVEHLLDQAEEVRAHPRDAGELGPVGDLVQRQPQPELARREGEPLLERQHVGPDVVDEVLVVRGSPPR